MKLTTLFVTLAAFVAGAAFTEAATVDHAGPWSQIHHKDNIKYFRIYTERSGADLRSAKPVYSKCVVSSDAAKKHDWQYFAEGSLLEFQRVGRRTVGINCPECTPQQLGNIYQTQLFFNCKVQDQRPANWKPHAAEPVDHAGPWSQIKDKKALQYITIFAEGPGADLRKGTPVYDKCTYTGEAAVSHDFDFFSKTNFLQFQQIGPQKLGINCPHCTPPELGNFVSTELYFDCAVQDHRPADWKPPHAALTKRAEPVDHAGPWSQIHHKKALKHVKIFAEPQGADLRHAKPVYSKCVYNDLQAQPYQFHYFSKTNFLKFQQIGKHSLGINCPDCSPQELGNLVATKLIFTCAIKDHRPADWKPHAALTKRAEPAPRAGPWKAIQDGDKVEHFKIFAERPGTDLKTAKARYDKCFYKSPAAKKAALDYYVHSNILRFAQLDRGVVGINCATCTKKDLFSIYEILGMRCDVRPDAPLVSQSGDWSYIEDDYKKDIKYLKVYAEPSGADLRKAKPYFEGCEFTDAESREKGMQQFTQHWEPLEFQQLGPRTLGVNCAGCTQDHLKKVYKTFWFTCGQQHVDWHKNGGN